MTSEEREELIEKRNNIGGDGMRRIIINSAGYPVWEGTNIIVGKQSRREKMTIEEINARIKAVEGIKEIYESERDGVLDKTVAGTDTDTDFYELAEEYLAFAREVDLLERELKRLGSEKVRLIIGNPPYDGDEA